MKKNGMGIISTIVIVYAGLCGFLYLAQRSLIYYPVPASSNLLAEDLRLPTEGETIQVWKQGGEHEETLFHFKPHRAVSKNGRQFDRWRWINPPPG